jgi:hypothetical protein
MDNSKTNIQDLTKLVLFTGRLSEIHIKNLQSFPFIYFNDIIEAKLDYDISQVKEVPSFIRYDLILSQENDQLNKRFDGLKVAVKSLFWKEMELKLSINGQEFKNE